MKQVFSMENSLKEILEQSGPEMKLYMNQEILALVPEKYYSYPLQDWAGDFLMPWGLPFPAESVIDDANMAANGTEGREIIPLWDVEDFDITANNIHSVCLIVPHCDLEGKRPCVVVVPGGGYETIVFHDEGFATAQRLRNSGYRTFILNYRYKPNLYPDPQLDLAMAIRYLRANAEKYEIDPDNMMVLGYSAGGHLCASTAALSKEITSRLDEEIEKYNPEMAEKMRELSVMPNKVCLGYPVISFLGEDHEPSFQALSGGDESLREHLSIEKQVGSDYPKTFLWTCEDDSLVPPSNTIRMAAALQEKRVPSMVRVYPQGEHGCGLGIGTSAEGWMEEMLEFMK